MGWLDMVGIADTGTPIVAAPGIWPHATLLQPSTVSASIDGIARKHGAHRQPDTAATPAAWEHAQKLLRALDRAPDTASMVSCALSVHASPSAHPR